MNDEPDPAEPGDPPPARGASTFWRRARQVRTPALVALGFVAVFAVIGWPRPPVWPFVTGGEIFVESPEVYTRERLVNDRYRQDFWLRSQLDALDASDALIARTEITRLALGDGDMPASDAEALRDAVVAFRDEFLLRAAIRDRIRQLVLENLLDDRHDLTGNSIYGLKFDTGIIPGTNTRLRPYVRVTIDLDAAEAGSALDSPRFLVGSRADRDDDRQSAFERTKRQFDGWTVSLEGRLRRYIDSRAERSAPGYCEPPAEARSDGGIVDALKADASGGERFPTRARRQDFPRPFPGRARPRRRL
jgi:hypothetical protein